MSKIFNRKRGRFLDAQILEALITKKWYKDPLSWFAILLAIITIIQTHHISKQNQRIEGFDTLLRYTNQTLIEIRKADSLRQQELLIAQLLHQAEVDHSSAVAQGDKNRFVAAVHNLGRAIEYWQFDESRNYIYLDEMDGIAIAQIESILHNELNNTFLISNKSIMTDWIEAYKHIKYLSNQAGFDTFFTIDFYDRPSSELDKVTKKYNRDVFSCRKSIMKAYQNSIRYIK